MCRECFNERRRSDWKHILFNQRAYQERLERHDTAYKEWLELITSKPFKPLTGKQWLKACAYFNGCALCTSNPIAARGYFVQFKDGGRYTAWNIIPLCEKCATARIVQSNPFRRLDPRLNPNGIPADRFEKILNYLREQLEEE